MVLLFDLDGTLTDPREGIVTCIRHALHTLGRTAPPDADLLHFIGPPLEDSFRTLLGRDDLARQALQAYRERYAVSGILENTVYPGIEQALSALKASGLRLMVATSKPVSFARSIVKHFGLAHYFAAVHGSEFSGLRANKSDLLAYILREHGLCPSDCIMVGDRSYDVLAARQNAIDSIGVLWGYGSREELSIAAASFLAATPGDLIDTVHIAKSRISGTAPM